MSACRQNTSNIRRKNELEIIRQYAAAHSTEIVRAHSYHSCSGLNIAGRQVFNQVMNDGKTTVACGHQRPSISYPPTPGTSGPKYRIAALDPAKLSIAAL